MNKTLWKMQIFGERLWTLARSIAHQAANLSLDGKGLAVVADETRTLAIKLHDLVEKAMFEEIEIETGSLRDCAVMLNLLALNNAIESCRLGERGKAAAVCADDIRNLAYEVTLLLGEDNGRERHLADLMPGDLMPKNRMVSVDKSQELIVLNIGGVIVVEPLLNVKEVCMNNERTLKSDWTRNAEDSGRAERSGSFLKLRGMDIPFIDGFAMLNKTQDEPTNVILQTPWADQNKNYAVAADVLCIFRRPVGIPSAAPAGTPFNGFIREHWESEGDAPFLFLDWPKMV